MPGKSTQPGTYHHPHQNSSMRNLPLGAPDVLEETVALGETVQRIVALTHGANEARQGVNNVLALDGTAVLVHLSDGDLARAVVLGPDDPARRRALAGDVTERSLMSARTAGGNRGEFCRAGPAYRSTISPRSFSIFAACYECCEVTVRVFVAVPESRTEEFQASLEFRPVLLIWWVLWAGHVHGPEHPHSV